MKSIATWLPALVVFSVSAAAHAAPFGESGQFSVSAERLFGFTHSSVVSEEAVGEVTTTSSRISLLTSPAQSSDGQVYTAPRLGFDYFLIDRVSAGLSLGYSNVSREREAPVGAVTVSGDLPTLHAFHVALRGGFAYAFSDLLAVWGRGGFTYVSAGSDDPDVNVGLWALSLEVPFVISPVPHVSFTLGPTLDIGLSGSVESEAGNGTTTERDLSATEIGVLAGLVASF